MAIFSCAPLFAENIENLPTIELETNNELSNTSSEQTQSHTLENVSSATIDQIRKRPTYELHANTGIQYGSWDTLRYETDISGSITQDGRIRGRILGFEQTRDLYLKQDAYALVNLMASYDISSQLSFQVNVNNIINEKYLFSFLNEQGLYEPSSNYTAVVKFKY